MHDTPALAAPVATQKMTKKVDAAVTTVKVKTQAKAKKAVSAKSAVAAALVVDAAKVPVKRRVAKKAAVAPATTPVKAKAAPAKVAKKVAVTTPKAKPKVAVKAKAKKTKAAVTSVQALDLKGNSAKLMAHLQGVLTTADFTGINQSAVAKVAGIPVGSMGATIARLVKAGQIVSGTDGSLKLAVIPAAAASATQAEAQHVAPVTDEAVAQA